MKTRRRPSATLSWATPNETRPKTFEVKRVFEPNLSAKRVFEPNLSETRDRAGSFRQAGCEALRRGRPAAP